MKKIYVAGASKELQRCKRVIASLKEAGCYITHDWTVAVEKYGPLGNETVDLKKEARADAFGIDEAGLFILLHPALGIHTTGVWWELGAASSRGIPVIISAESKHSVHPDESPCIFTRLHNANLWVQDQDLPGILGAFGAV